MDQQYPVDALRERVQSAVSRNLNRWILTAPTGSGKSTRVPQMILDSPDFSREREVVILEPRRLAARLLARWVAAHRGTRVGSEVGYQVRFDKRTGPQTRIRYVTEGILLRQMHDDPELSKVGCVILDEFHERHLYTDITLGLIRELQDGLRPDLILCVMSATLDTKALEDYLPGSVKMKAEGRVHPVETAYGTSGETDPRKPIWERVQLALNRVLPGLEQGNVLIFLPGSREIRKTIDLLMRTPACRGWELAPLFGDLSPEEQDQAVEGTGKRRKIIVSTNVAETSVTIEGISLVIDSGLARFPGYDPRRGINTLYMEPISRFSSDQRAGRAGRTGPGSCLRLWKEKEQEYRSLATTPEILRVDLAETCLFLKASNIRDIREFPWLDRPSEAQLNRAEELLEDLGAVDENGKLTETGWSMVAFPVHPRYGRMFLYGSEQGCFPELALAAVLAQGRPIFTGDFRDRPLREVRDRHFLNEETAKSDFLYCMEALLWAKRQHFSPGACRELGVHAGACRQAERVARQFTELARQQGLDTRGGNPDLTVIRKGLLLGFADQLGVRVDSGTRRCRLIHGRSGELRRDSVISGRGLLVAADLEEVSRGTQTRTLLGLVTQVDMSWLKSFFPRRFREESATTWDESGKRIIRAERICFHDLVLESRESEAVDPATAAALWAEGILEGRFTIKAWGGEVERWIRRVNFLSHWAGQVGLPPIDGEARKTILETLCNGMRSSREIRELDPWPVLKSWIPAGYESWMERMAPVAIELPTRRRPCLLRYDNPEEPPVLAARIQELYDVNPAQLTVLNGELPVRLEILAPNRNPVQMMSADRLPEFWEGSYPEIRKALMGRYPRHEWR